MPKVESLSHDWIIQNYASAQFQAAVEVLSSAFLDDPASVYIFPETLKREKSLPWLFNLILHYGIEQGWVYTAAGRTSGKVAGVAIWLPAERAVIPMITQIRLGMWAAPIRLGLWSLKRVLTYSIYLDQLRKRYGKQNFLWMLGVKPTHQGKEGGTALLEEGLNSLRGHCYLETHKERNLHFYRRHGFTVVFEGDIPTGGPHVWVMECRRESK